MIGRRRTFTTSWPPTTALHGLGARTVVSLRREHGTWVPEHEAPTGLQIGLLDTPGGAEGGHLGLAEHALTLSLAGPRGIVTTAFSTEGTHGASPASGAFLTWRSAGTPFALRAGWMGEREAVLGTSARGAFGGLSADAVFAGVDAETDIGGWRLIGGAELGSVATEWNRGLIADLTPLTTSAFAVRATRPLGHERGLSLSVSQPLRLESGQATLSVPAGRTKGGEVLRRPVSADLSPTGRQIDVAARWHRRWKDAGELRLGAVWTRELGHRAPRSRGSPFSRVGARHSDFGQALTGPGDRPPRARAVLHMILVRKIPTMAPKRPEVGSISGIQQSHSALPVPKFVPPTSSSPRYFSRSRHLNWRRLWRIGNLT